MSLKSFMRRPAAQRAACALLRAYMRLAVHTTRWRYEGSAIPESFWRDGKPFILAFWHGRLMLIPFAWGRRAKISILISHHADGRLIADTVRPFGIDSIAGSSSRGGASAMRGLLRELKEGRCIGFTPDGPRGPRMRASDGVIQAARLSGAPIIPCAFSSSRRKLFASWDRFVLPLPFGRGVFLWDEPLPVGRDDDVEAARLRLETRLNALCERADALCGVAPIAPAAPDELPKGAKKVQA